MAIYNGIRLPDLPAYDTVAYPYSHIQQIRYSDGSFIAHLRCSDQPFYFKTGGIGYNGILLPPLPEWDRETYPYAAIATAWVCPYILWVKTGPTIYDGEHVKDAVDGTCMSWQFRNGEWTSGSSGNYAAGGYLDPVWTNYDVLDTEGSVYLAASAPAEIPDTVTNTEGAAVIIRDYMDRDAQYAWGNEYTLPNIALTLAPSTVVWCSTDILDDDGNIFLAATDPVPEEPCGVPVLCLENWITGLILGLAGSGAPGDLPEPAAADNGPATPIHPSSLLAGWLTGCAIR